MNNKPIAKQISSVYFVGVILLLAFYSLFFSLIILQTENLSSERRLAIVSPQHFSLYVQGLSGELAIDPLITIYDDYQLLPSRIKESIPKQWLGVTSLQFDDDSEFSIFAQIVNTPKGKKTAYSLENVGLTEWNDDDFLLIELILFASGLVIFLVIAAFIFKASWRVSSPFIQLASLLEKSSTESAQENFQELKLSKVSSVELAQTLTAINKYRAHIFDLLEREKSFTRYVSHEMRTPMTVIKGSLSILRRVDDKKVIKQITRIYDAVEQMEQLTNTFLLLARNEPVKNEVCKIDDDFVNHLKASIESKARANETKVSMKLIEQFSLAVEPLLLFSACQNILLNAINSTIEGTVEVTVSKLGIKVIDSGVGLDEKARGYEGFGIGLLIVNDICNKYQWQFSLSNNSDKGCCANILF